MKDGYTHITFEDRNVIECDLNNKRSLSAIAKRLGRDVSTIRREILRNRRFDGKSNLKSREKNDCARLDTCHVHALCRNGCHVRLCRRCGKDCHAYCDEYVPRECGRTSHAPFVCNGCSRYPRCILLRYKYSARSADELARRRAAESREGVNLVREEMDLLISTVKEGLALGQSIHHIFQTRELPCSERSFYRYVENEQVPILSIELAKKVRYKKRKRKKSEEGVHRAGFYLGRTYDDLLAVPEDERAWITEVDTVCGIKRDSKCILSLHRKDIHFQIYLLLPDKTKKSVVRAFDWLEECCEDPEAGQNRFSELFGLMLLDRGCEFDAIEEMEGSKDDREKKRCACYFADPSRPDQKGACEKNHVELRKLLPKGTSFDGLDAATLAEICSHVNSSVRRGCGNATPFDLAALVFPPCLFENLGLRRIPPKGVIAAPNILYRPE